MRRLPYSGIVALAALLAGPILLEVPAQACDENYPSCMLPELQAVQEQPSADDASDAEDVDVPVVRPAAPRQHQKSHHTAEPRPAHQAATTPPRSQTARRDPGRASMSTLPPWPADASANRTGPTQQQMPPQAGTVVWPAPAPVIGDTSAAAAPPSATADSAVGQIAIADPNEGNTIDLAATDTPAPPDLSWLHGLLAVLGGALAAGSAARLLLV
jgi:hypothetical protein